MINVFRSFPLIILFVLVIPFTRLVVGKAIGTTASIVPLTLSAIPFIAWVMENALRETNPGVIEAAKSFGASNLQQLFTVAIPTALPMIMTGLRVALGAAWSAVIAAELLASSSGIGFMIQQCRGLARPDIIIAGMIAIGLIGTLLTWLLGLLEKLVLKGGNSKR